MRNPKSQDNITSVADFAPTFSKSVYLVWIARAAEKRGYAAAGQVERWRECVRQWERIEAFREASEARWLDGYSQVVV
jgi:hypothetical protein